MEGEVGALVESLRAGARRLATDLAAVETGMHELYDAASGRGLDGARRRPPPPCGRGARNRSRPPSRRLPPRSPPRTRPPKAAPAPAAAAPEPAPPRSRRRGQETGPGDIDGARLVALNMALNGESRDDTERYLAENFELPDRLKLVDEVYAAVEG